ncbi:MAG: InlB B-repeat-containing protein [Candidatus Saccharibacteria bacterium]|nr:InlB B-repeat-containing protein [Candidatus Saccharibacteria bacterium]
MKKSIGYFSVAFLTSALLANNASAATIVDIANGYAEKDNKVTILNEKGLEYFAGLVNSGNTFEGKYVTLSKDLDLSSYNWTPIGDSNRGDTANHTPFMGTFDGYNHTINGLNISSDKSDYCYGLFGIIKEAKITNVVIESGNINAPQSTAGAVVACMLGNVNTVENNVVKTGVTVKGLNAGGVIGRAYGKENYIYNNENGANVTADEKSGGIAAIDNNLTIMYGNKNSGTITGKIVGTGGIIGFGNGKSFIANSENTGAVNSKKYSGGIVGYTNGADSYVINSKNSGEIYSDDTSGGIVGVAAKNSVWGYKNVINSGAVKGGTVSTCTAGGIIGTSGGNSTFIDVENSAEVTGCDYAGGIAGQLGEKNYVINSKGGTAKIEGNKHSGRIAGVVNTGSSTKNLSTGLDAHVYIDDNNGDSYDGIGTFGSIAPLSGMSAVVVEKGTIHGVPVSANHGRITFLKGTKWDAVENAELKLFINKSGSASSSNFYYGDMWTVDLVLDNSKITTTEPTTAANGSRVYDGLVNGSNVAQAKITEPLNKLRIDWGDETVTEAKTTTTVSYASLNDSSTKSFSIDKKLDLGESEVYQEPAAGKIGLEIAYTNDNMETQAKYFKKVTYHSNGGEEYEPEIVYLDSLDADINTAIDKTPTRDGYLFDGWYYDEELTQEVSEGDDYLVDVYAKWINLEGLENPKTGDNIAAYVTMFATCILGLYLAKRK